MTCDAQEARSGTSVIMPVRNGARHIAEGIASALAQLDDGDQIVVVDDASADETRSIVSALRDPRIELHEGSGRGVSSARNIGLKAAKGKFVAFLDHDDLWPAARHENLMTQLLGNPGLDAVFGRVRVRFDEGIDASPKYLALDGKHLEGAGLCTGLFHARIISRIEGFDEGMRFGEDTDFYMRLAEAGMRAKLCDVDALVYRRHRTNSTNTQAAALDGLSEVLQRRIARARARKAESKD